jgi:hypothetical protein
VPTAYRDRQRLEATGTNTELLGATQGLLLIWNARAVAEIKRKNLIITPPILITKSQEMGGHSRNPSESSIVLSKLLDYTGCTNNNHTTMGAPSSSLFDGS